MPEHINLLEIRDRRVRVTTSGTEIEITWYCEPATAAPIVISCLLGGVTANTSSGNRILPASDVAFPFCYCVSAHEMPLDSRSIASGPEASPEDDDDDIDFITDALQSPAIFNGPYSLKADGSYDGDTKDTDGLCGANIHATYRPLNSYFNTKANNPAGDPNGVSDPFDYVDAQFHPCNRTIDVGSSLRILYNIPTMVVGYAVDGSPQMTETWQEFTIRRVMCPSVPWQTIRALTNRINDGRPWNLSTFTLPGLPGNSFPQGTLRFDYADVIPRVLPANGGSNLDKVLTTGQLPITARQVWFDILYKFSWRTVTANWVDLNGQQHTKRPPTWNCEWCSGVNGWQALTTLDGLTSFFSGGGSKGWLPGWYETGYATGNAPDLTYINNWIYRKKYLDVEDGINPTGLTVQGGQHPFDLLFLNTSS